MKGMIAMFNKEAREIRKRAREARKKAKAYAKRVSQGPYRGAKIRAEDSVPPPDWPIIGFQKPTGQANTTPGNVGSSSETPSSV